MMSTHCCSSRSIIAIVVFASYSPPELGFGHRCTPATGPPAKSLERDPGGRKASHTETIRHGSIGYRQATLPPPTAPIIATAHRPRTGRRPSSPPPKSLHKSLPVTGHVLGVRLSPIQSHVALALCHHQRHYRTIDLDVHRQVVVRAVTPSTGVLDRNQFA
jgi:hypothetical protein